MQRRCTHHPDRPVHALCMACQRALCLECVTTWEGIHFCARCLADRRTAAHRSSPWPMWVVLGLAVAVLLTLHTRVLAWFGVLVAELR